MIDTKPTKRGEKGQPNWERMAPPECSVCYRRIVGCIGKHGDWKHVGTNKEHGEDGHIALPQVTL